MGDNKITFNPLHGDDVKRLPLDADDMAICRAKLHTLGQVLSVAMSNRGVPPRL
jgi:hypothetical protein